MTASAGGTRVPPGRAGILRLRRRLAVAEAGADLLARKLTVLSVEADRLAAVAGAAERRWQAVARDAQQILDRAAQLAGDRAVRLAVLPPQARVKFRRTALMGLGYPGGAAVDLPARPAGGPPPADAALVLAERAVRTAVPAAAHQAAAARATAIVTHEAQLTRRRLRALEHRRIPALRRALDQAVAHVEEAERADAVLRRWTTERSSTDGGSHESTDGERDRHRDHTTEHQP